MMKKIYTLGDCHLPFLSLQDQKRVEKVSKRESAIQEVKESVSLLDQLLQAFSRESSSHSNQELVKVSELTLDTFKNKNQLQTRSPPRASFDPPTRVCLSGSVPALREDEAHAVQVGQRHRGQRRRLG